MDQTRVYSWGPLTFWLRVWPASRFQASMPHGLDAMDVYRPGFTPLGHVSILAKSLACKPLPSLQASLAWRNGCLWARVYSWGPLTFWLRAWPASRFQASKPPGPDTMDVYGPGFTPLGPFNIVAKGLACWPLPNLQASLAFCKGCLWARVYSRRAR